MRIRAVRSWSVIAAAPALVSLLAVAADPHPGEAPALGPDRVSQELILSGELTERQLIELGLRVFTTSFNAYDGYGDGPMNPADTTSPGGRPTLGGNGRFLRVNGLDAQSCLECHSIVSNAAVPPLLGIGGVGGANSNAMIKPTSMDPSDEDDLDGAAGFNGRFANPPFIFGAGGVELLALEMTAELQALERDARSRPGVRVDLVTKGIGFGSVVADAYGRVDRSGVEGVDDDLVVRPFGRKGEFATTRDFDVDAMQFHFGMQPVEVVGVGVDADLDGVTDEVTVGELSALQVFVSSRPRPTADRLDAAARRGRALFDRIECSTCHVPELQTRARLLPLRVTTDPQAAPYFTVDLSAPPAKFDRNGDGGVRVPLFADLKRHDMGEGLAEQFALVDEMTNRRFTTARLWGVADTAPYLHDGRAMTLSDAILLHGGEAQAPRDRFAALSDQERIDLLSFLRSLRTPGASRRERPPTGPPASN